MNYADIRKQAREDLKGNWTTAVVSVLIFSIIIGTTESFGYAPIAIFSILGLVASIILTGPLNYGLNLIFLKISRKEKAEVGDLFVGFNDNMWNKVSAGLSILVYTFLWSLLLIIPGIIASYSYSMTYFIMKDNPQLTAEQAITKSKVLMRGNKLKLFCLDLTFIGWIFLGILSLGIGMFWVTSYMNSARAIFYQEITGKTFSTDLGDEKQENTVIKSESEISPYSNNDQFDIIYRLKCDSCGATDTDTKESSTCPYCGGKMNKV